MTAPIRTPDADHTLCVSCYGRAWCKHCEGTGRVILAPSRRCTWCAGRGECPVCDGDGQLSEADIRDRGIEVPAELGATRTIDAPSLPLANVGHFRESDRPAPKVMARTHGQLAARSEVTPLRVQDRFNHWEDEDLGIPPVETAAWFEVRFGSFVFATVETTFEWPAGDPEQIAVRLWLDGFKPARWFAVIDGSVRHVLESLGFKDSGQWQATWAANDSSVDGIVTQIERVGETPIRVL